MPQVTDYLLQEGKDHPRAAEMKDAFASVIESIYTLYACMSGGVNWKQVSDDLIDIHWMNGCALSFYVFFTLFVVCNILTGIFVDTAIQSASSDREEVIQEQLANQDSELLALRAIFEEADEDGSRHISLKEFETHLRNPRVCAHFASIGIEIRQAVGLFKLLDQDASGEVGIEEFVMGCMRLKGGAKGIDLATLMYENKRLVANIKGLEEFCRTQFGKLEEFTQMLAHKYVDLNDVTLVIKSDSERQGVFV
jgi:Ca2+-binding EF-hand superfamily protein